MTFLKCRPCDERLGDNKDEIIFGNDFSSGLCLDSVFLTLTKNDQTVALVALEYLRMLKGKMCTPNPKRLGRTMPANWPCLLAKSSRCSSTLTICICRQSQVNIFCFGNHPEIEMSKQKDEKEGIIQSTFFSF